MQNLNRHLVNYASFWLWHIKSQEKEKKFVTKVVIHRSIYKFKKKSFNDGFSLSKSRIPEKKQKQNKRSDHVDELKPSLNLKACLIQFSSIF